MNRPILTREELEKERAEHLARMAKKGRAEDFKRVRTPAHVQNPKHRRGANFKRFGR